MKQIYKLLIFLGSLLYLQNTSAQITCSFTLQDTLACNQLPVLATPTEVSSFPITQRCWDLTGPQNFSSGCGNYPTFSYIATDCGLYTLTLTSTNSAGNTCSVSRPVRVSCDPVIDFTFSPTSGCLPFATNATCNIDQSQSTIDSVFISWGCGTIETILGCSSTSIPHTYLNCTPGPVSPTISAVNEYGCRSNRTFTNAITIQPCPRARFVADTTSAYCTNGPLTVTFTADTTVPNSEYCWYINNQPQTPCLTSRTFTYSFPVNNSDCYDVMLVVRHVPSGRTDTMLRPNYICVNSSSPISITSSASSLCVNPASPGVLTLYNNNSGNLLWELTGPSGTSFPPITDDTVTYTISQPGSYSLHIRAVYGPGCVRDTIINPILTATLLPSTSFTVADSITCVSPFQVSPTMTNLCAGCTFVWQAAGNPSTSNASNPTFTFQVGNPRRLALVVTSPNGCVSTIERFITIRPLVPTMALSNAKGCSPVTFTVTNTTDTSFNDPINSICWSFPGSSIPTVCGVNSVTRTVTTPGCFDVSLNITTTTGCNQTLLYPDSICVGTPPTCTLTANPTTQCFGSGPVSFNLNCTSFGYARVNYGDVPTTYTVTSPNFSHTYTATGTFTVTVIPYSNNCADSANILTTTIRVNPPIAAFTTTRSCALGDTIVFNNSSVGATSYTWGFNCPTFSESSILPTPRIEFPPCDTCTATLTATNSSTGCTNSITLPVITNCNLVAVSPDDTQVCVNQIIRFRNNSPSQISNRTRWDFDVVNGQVVFTHSGNPSPPTSYPSPGNYVVAMENRTTSQCLDTVFARVSVCDTFLDFSFNNSCFPADICFTGYATDTICPVSVWSWSFGDGTTATATSNPCHQYPAPGSYNVTLTVQRGTCITTKTKTVTVAGNLTFSYEVDTILCPGVQHCIVNNSTGSNLTFAWEIPNARPYNDTASFPGPCFTIDNIGDYPTIFSASSDSLCFNRDTLTLHVNQPVAMGTVSEDTLNCSRQLSPLQFTLTSQYVDSVLWDFGDGSRTIIRDPTHFYTDTGTYIVRLCVGDINDGCFDCANIDTILVRGPYGDFSTDPVAGVCACKDSMNIVVNTVYATSITMVYGCNQGFQVINNITPGTPNNPTSIPFVIPYCVIDSCRPQLIFEDNQGCEVYFERDTAFIYIDSPVVNFTFNNYGVCNNGTVCFQDATTYNLLPFQSFTVRREWDFGDNTPIDTSQNPCHYYANPGAYFPILRIWSNVGCFDSLTTQVVVVSDYPEAGYFADDTLFCEDDSTCFHDTSTIYQFSQAAFWTWDFGDGSPVDTFYQPDVCHFYADGGDFRVTMCVYDTLGCPDCDSSTVIHVISDPVADAGPDRVICKGIPTTLNGSGAVYCHWFPQALFANDSICDADITLYNDTVVVLEVGDIYGCTNLDTAFIRAGSVTANFGVRPSYCLNNSICPTDSSTSIYGTVNAWSWDFGDLTNQNIQAPCHQYTDTGYYDILLVATDNNGCVDSAIKTIYLYENPEALFSLNDSVICSYQQLCFTNLSTSGAPITNYYWNFGIPSANSTAQNPPCYSYNRPYLPDYDITLVIVDVNQCTDTSTLNVIFWEAPTVGFDWQPSCEDEQMSLVSTTVLGDGGIASCEWIFWLGSPNPTVDNNCNTSFQFPPGSHDVQYSIVDDNGCVDTIVRTVFTDSLTQLVLNPGDTTVCLGTPLDYFVDGVYDILTWTPNTWIENPNGPIVSINPLGNVGYIVTAVNGVCDPVSDTFNVRVIQPIPIEVIATPDKIVLGLSSNITSTIPGQIDSIIWDPFETLDCRECPNPVATPTSTTTYTATVYNTVNGVSCNNSASVTIYVLNSCGESIVYLPNTFTPNDDGLNDIFMIRGLAATKINYFRIFDRWGKLVFETNGGVPNDTKWGWDGTVRSGGKAEPAVFVYSYEIECVNGDIVSGSGNVTLVR